MLMLFCTPERQIYSLSSLSVEVEMNIMMSHEIVVNTCIISIDTACGNYKTYSKEPTGRKRKYANDNNIN